MCFCGDVRVDLPGGPGAIFQDVVFVVELGEAFGQGQVVAELPVDLSGQFSRCQRACEVLAGQDPGDGFLTSTASARVMDQAEFVECRQQDLGHVVVGLMLKARRQCA